MSSEVYLLYLATVAVFFATPPGPSQILIISNSLRYGISRSAATIAGDLSANMLQMAAAGFGLAVLFAQSAQFLNVVKWTGVIYLVFMGVRVFLAMPAKGPQLDIDAATTRQLYLQGFLTSAANPKAVLFFAALFPQFINASDPIWPQLSILGVTYLLIDGCLLFAYGTVANSLLGRLKNNTLLLDRLSGVLMIGAALLLATKSLEVR